MPADPTVYNGDKFMLRTTINGAPDQLVAGLVSNGFSLSNEMIDVTVKSDDGFTRKISGIKSASLSGNGIFSDDQSMTEISARALAGTEAEYLIVNDSTNQGWRGNFLISSFEMSGDASGALQFTLSLESNGAVTATP